MLYELCAQVLVLYTGGTIGMVRNSEGALAPFPHAMEDRIRATITMHDEEYSKSRFMDIGAGTYCSINAT